MTFSYHITCKEMDSKKLVVVESKAEVESKIRAKFNVPASQTLCLKQAYEDDWLDVKDFEDLPDSGKLLLMVKVSLKCKYNFCKLLTFQISRFNNINNLFDAQCIPVQIVCCDDDDDYDDGSDDNWWVVSMTKMMMKIHQWAKSVCTFIHKKYDYF